MFALASGIRYGASLTVSFILLLLVGLINRPKINLSEFALNYLLFGFAFALFISFKLFSPEIYWGEKYGELSLLYFLSRFDSLPAADPWAYPNPLKYYFIHYLLLGGMTNVLGLNPTILFNVAVALVPAALFVSFYEIIADGNRSKLCSLFGALIVFLGNVEAVKLFYFSNKPWGFDTFWATTRSFPHHLFAEYPIWSFLFGDLHPHYMNYTLLGASLAATFFALKNQELKTLAVVSFLAGASLGFNSWDTVTLCIFIGCVWLYSLRNSTFALKLALTGATSAGIGYLIFKPLISGKTQLAIGVLNPSETMTFSDVFSHFGIFWIINSALTVWIAAKERISCLVFSILTSSCFSLASEYGLLPHKSSLVSYLTLSVALNFCLSIHDRGKHLYAYICWIAGSLIVFITETVFIADRMNTVFKMYCFVWILYSISCALMLREIFSEKIFKYLAVLVVLVSTPIVYSMAGHGFERGQRPTLRGDLFLLNENFKYDGEAIVWLREQLDSGRLPLGTVLEATNDSYRGTNFFSAFTGLPTVLGWWHHAGVRGSSRNDVEARKSDIISFYSYPTDEQIKKLKEKYNVTYIFFGKLERELYPSALLNFQSDLLEKIFDNGHAFIYRVKL